jgi:3-oxoadipate enol-lactonase
MGGMIGQALALAHPDRVESLVLADTAAIIPNEAQEIWQEPIDTVRCGGMQGIAEATLQRWFTPAFHARNPAAIDQIQQQILATPVAGYIGCSEAIRKLDLLDKLPLIQLPTLIIVGADDPGTPVAAYKAMHARMKTSRPVVIPSAAHLSNIERLEEFNANLTRHLGQQKSD